MLKEKLEKLDRPEVKLNESFCQTERNSNRTVLIQTEPIPNKRTRESGAQTDPIGPIPLAYQNQDSRIVDSPPFHYTKVVFLSGQFLPEVSQDWDKVMTNGFFASYS